MKRLLQNESRLNDENTIGLFVRLSGDLIQAVAQGKLSEDAASIRALLDACDLSSMVPPKRAIRRAIADKLDEDREKTLVHTMAETLFG